MKNRIIPYNSKLKVLSRELRKHSTVSEVLLWNKLKCKQIKGYRFLRQRPLDEFIVDFYCNELMLAIEIDGSSHDFDESYEYDDRRQKRLEELGVSFIRFKDIDVKRDMFNVLRGIEFWIEDYEEKHSPESPLKRGLK